MTSLVSSILDLPPRDLVLADTLRSFSRVELRKHIKGLANLLRASDCHCLGLHADNSVAWVIADLACHEANVVCVPLPLFFTWPQTLHAIHECGIDAILTAEPGRFAEHFPSVDDGKACFDLSLLRQSYIHRPRLPAATGKISFTSGSTGAPRGVCLSNAQQWRQAVALKDAVGIANAVHLCALPLATLLENIAGVYAPLLAGGKVVLRSMAELGFSGSRLTTPDRFLRTISDVQPNTLILIPQLLQLLVTAAGQGWQAPSLQYIAVGGSRVSPELIDTARELGLPVYEGYGLTECASVVSLNTPGSDRAGTCGRPLPHLQIELIGDEIYISGNPMLGYLDDPASWHATRIATGDLGSIDCDGFVHVEGRRKNLLISSYGRNISPEWVESELLAVPALREAVVFGDARPHCIALLTPVSSELSDIAIATAVTEANTHLPDYAQVRQWLRLPLPLAVTPGMLTANGRPLRDAILRRYRPEIDALYLSGGSSDTRATFNTR